MAKEFVEPTTKTTPQPDYQRGISQENLEDLRTEFLSTGGMVDVLPEPSEVRDWTIVGLQGKDNDGHDEVTLFVMMLGGWFDLGNYTHMSPHSEGSLDQFDTESEIVIGATDTIYEISSANELSGNDDWVLSHSEGVSYKDGVFTMIEAGHYTIAWSLSFHSGGSNQDYEGGILKNGENLQRGWAHRKISGSGDIGSFGAHAIMDLKTGDRISIGVVNETSTANFFINHANIVIHRT